MKVRPSAAGLLGWALATGAVADEATHLNVTAGGPLRPGVYGRIQVRGAVPPAVVFPDPVTAVQTDRTPADPIYLYVPPGQVRRWSRHCAKWKACERPVFFVRVDDSPSRLGAWKKARRTAAPELPGLDALARLVQP